MEVGNTNTCDREGREGKGVPQDVADLNAPPAAVMCSRVFHFLQGRRLKRAVRRHMDSAAGA
jgi:hypothetical protein